MKLNMLTEDSNLYNNILAKYEELKLPFDIINNELFRYYKGFFELFQYIENSISVIYDKSYASNK